MVIANLMISPSEAYVLKYATVKYKVEQIRQNSVVGKNSAMQVFKHLALAAEATIAYQVAVYDH